MPRSTLPAVTAPGNYPTLQPTAASLDVTMTATVVADKTQFAIQPGKKYLVLAHNTGAAPHTVTINSSVDVKTKRTGDITGYSVGAGKISQFGPFEAEGWAQTDGYVYAEADHIEIKFGVIILPQ